MTRHIGTRLLAMLIVLILCMSHLSFLQVALVLISGDRVELSSYVDLVI